MQYPVRSGASYLWVSEGQCQLSLGQEGVGPAISGPVRDRASYLWVREEWGQLGTALRFQYPRFL